METEFSVAVDCGCKIGECPLWHPTEVALYWTDIPNGRLHRYDPRAGEARVVLENGMIGGFTCQTDGSLLLFEEGGAVELLRDGRTETVLAADGDRRQFNDVVADPLGGVFCGQLPAEDAPGTLFRLDTDGTLNEVVDAVGLPNGMGFSPDGTTFYLTDSEERRIDRFDFDRSTGAIGNRQPFAAFPDERVYDGLSAEHYPVPDGMTVDRAGHVWTCLFGGEGLVRLDPDGAETGRLETPVKQSTSLTFGGPSYSDLYVTSGWLAHADHVDDLAGAVFRARLGTVRGRPERRSRVLV